MNGILSNWTRHQYDADTSRVRSTSMKSFCDPQGPRSYYLKHVASEPREDGDDYGPKVNDLLMGTLFHELMIDGKVGWFALPEKNGRAVSRRSPAFRAACARNPGLIPIPSRCDADLWAWREAVLRNDEARWVLEARRFNEQVILWDRKTIFRDADRNEWEVDIPAKVAIDILPYNLDAFYCLKTTRATNREEWERQVERLNYAFSGAFYLEGMGSVEQFAGFNRPIKHIWVTKQHPHHCYVTPLDHQWMQIGAAQVRFAFELYARCTHDQQNGVPALEAWPDFEERRQSDPLTPTMRAMERAGFREAV